MDHLLRRYSEREARIDDAIATLSIYLDLLRARKYRIALKTRASMKDPPTSSNDTGLVDVPYITGFNALCWAAGESIIAISFCGPALDGGAQFREVLLILGCYWVIVAMIMIRRFKRLTRGDCIFIIYALPIFLCIREFLGVLF